MSGDPLEQQLRTPLGRKAQAPGGRSRRSRSATERGHKDRESVSGRSKQGSWFRQGSQEAAPGSGKAANTPGVRNDDFHGRRWSDGMNSVFFQTRSTILLEKTKSVMMEELRHLESQAEGRSRKLLKTEE